jgi:hypothetical protein
MSIIKCDIIPNMAGEYLVVAQGKALADAPDASRLLTSDFVSSTYEGPKAKDCKIAVYAKARKGNVIETGIKRGDMCSETGDKLI